MKTLAYVGVEISVYTLSYVLIKLYIKIVESVVTYELP